MRVVRHLVKNKLGHFYVRVYVPKDLREIVKKKELRRSLRTTCEAIAYRRSHIYVEGFRRYFRSLRERCGMLYDGIHFTQMISIGNLTKTFPDGRKEIAENVTLEGEIEEKFLAGMIGDGGDKLAESDDIVTVDIVEAVPVVESSLEIAADLSKVDVYAIERPRFSELVERIYRSKKRRREKADKPVDSRWFNDYRLVEHLLIESIGNKYIDKYTETDAQQFFDDLSGLPKGYTKAKKWQKVPLREVVDNPMYSSEENMSDSRLYNLELRANAIFSAGVKLGKLKYSVFHEFIRDKPGSVSWEPFSGVDLCKIFDAHIPLNVAWPSHYWVPLIALFTGMRRSEIFYRVADDIQQDRDGVWYIDIHRRNGARTKNKASVRKLPIHSRLIDMGLIEYVTKVAKQCGAGARLFPEYEDCKGQAGYKFSDYFANYMDLVGITHYRKVFHSFRTTFINELESLEIYSPAIKRLCGHAGDGITHGTYGGKSRMQYYKEHIEQLDYDQELQNLPGWPY